MALRGVSILLATSIVSALLYLIAPAFPTAAQEHGEGDEHRRSWSQTGQQGRSEPPPGYARPRGGERGDYDRDRYAPRPADRSYPARSAPPPYVSSPPFQGRYSGQPSFRPSYVEPPPPGNRFRDPAPPSGAFRGDWRNDQDEVRQAVREGRHISLAQAIGLVRRRTPGRELDANLEPGPNGRSVYRLRWAAADGRRIDYLVDAASGEIIGAQGGR